MHCDVSRFAAAGPPSGSDDARRVVKSTGLYCLLFPQVCKRIQGSSDEALADLVGCTAEIRQLHRQDNGTVCIMAKGRQRVLRLGRGDRGATRPWDPLVGLKDRLVAHKAGMHWSKSIWIGRLSSLPQADRHCMRVRVLPEGNVEKVPRGFVRGLAHISAWATRSVAGAHGRPSRLTINPLRKQSPFARIAHLGPETCPCCLVTRLARLVGRPTCYIVFVLHRSFDPLWLSDHAKRLCATVLPAASSHLDQVTGALELSYWLASNMPLGVESR